MWYPSVQMTQSPQSARCYGLVSRLLTVGLLVGGVYLVLRMQPEPADPRDVVDYLADSGIELTPSPLELDLLEHRKIVMATDVNAAVAEKVIRSLLLLNARDGNQPIDLYIRTEGGWVSDAFGIVDVMESISAPVNTHAMGGTHSSGAVILAAGTGTRYAYPFSSIMFHAGLYDDDGPYGESTLDNRRLVDFWEQHAKLPAEWVHAEEEETYFLDPAKALELGVVDVVRGTKAGDDAGVE